MVFDVIPVDSKYYIRNTQQFVTRAENQYFKYPNEFLDQHNLTGSNWSFEVEK